MLRTTLLRIKFVCFDNASCSVFLDHLLVNVANGNEEHFRYIVSWMSHLVQRPEERVGIALAFRGRQGTGKTIVGQVLGHLIEANYALVDDPHYVTGNFNSHLASLLLLQVDEGFWAGDKQAEGRLKGLITSDRQMIEHKGKDAIQVRNFLRMIVTSNSDWVVPAGHEERRFAVFDVGDHCIQNHEYFAEMMRELESGGYGALLHHLLNFDFSDIDLRKIPTTAALFEQKIASLPPVETWWFTCLQRGWIGPPEANAIERSDSAIEDWPSELEKEKTHRAYIGYCDQLGIRHKKHPPQFGIALKKLAPGLSEGRPRAEGKRRYVYRFPSLELCRKQFAQSLKTEINWETGDTCPIRSEQEEEV